LTNGTTKRRLEERENNKGRRKEKRQGRMEERKKLEKRLEILEWEKERKDRERRRNNIVIRGKNEWGSNRIPK